MVNNAEMLRDNFDPRDIDYTISTHISDLPMFTAYQYLRK